MSQAGLQTARPPSTPTPRSDGFDFEDEAAPGEGGEPAAPAAGEGSACAAGAQEGAEGMEAEAGEEEELDDEALARRLHQEEQRALYQRMLEMSGYTAHQGEACGDRKGGPDAPGCSVTEAP